MSSVLAATWRWERVDGSERLHLCPPQVRRWSRTACNRLPLAEAICETPIRPDLPRCQACWAAGQKGGTA
jgi:hypothetical protein